MQDPSSEEKRGEHQDELRKKLNDDAKERLKGLKASGDGKKFPFFKFIYMFALNKFTSQSINFH